ncbi:MAG TPA: hypothetical protein DEB62_15645 [Vibrio sp.]|nr:hypothetical protein [Vibrio sp.]
MENSYYEVLAKPSNINKLVSSVDDYFLSLSDFECLNLIMDTFGFLKNHSNINVSINVNHIMLNNPIIVEYLYEEALKLRTESVVLSLELNEFCLSFLSCDELKKLSERFSNIDVAFWLDDFGCGSANLSSVITSNFKVIKIDKVIFWGFYLKYKSLLIELIFLLNLVDA